jgi:hypothetical protein
MRTRTLLTITLAALLAPASWAVEPPEQPDDGPGGTDYVHLLANTTYVFDGTNHYKIWEPSWPTPDSAPVFVFLSGIASPNGYLGLLEFSLFAAAYDPMFTHLARKGVIVILPGYGLGGAPLGDFEQNAVSATKSALAVLDGPFHVAPELDEVAYGGHSFGGLLAMIVAGKTGELGLPEARALICHEPALVAQFLDACAEDPEHPFCSVNIPPDFSGIPAGVLNLTIVGGGHRLDWLDETIAQWHLPQVPRAMQTLLYIHDDAHGDAPLVATHMSDGAHPYLPIPGFEQNAIDWYGYWKPTQAALAYAFWQDNREYVVGDGDEVTFMGLWSDGTPVVPMSTADDLWAPIGP